MKPEDRLIIDGRGVRRAEDPGYRDKPATRDFASALFASLGISRDDGEFRFDHKRDERHDGLHLITRTSRGPGSFGNRRR